MCEDLIRRLREDASIFEETPIGKVVAEAADALEALQASENALMLRKDQLIRRAEAAEAQVKALLNWSYAVVTACEQGPPAPGSPMDHAIEGLRATLKDHT